MNMRGTLKAIILPTGLLVLWQDAMGLTGNQSDTLATPLAIVSAIYAGVSDGSLIAASGQTLLAGGLGLILGAGMGIILGLIFGFLPQLSRLMGVTTEMLRPLPSVALVPIAILVLGFGYSMEIAIVAFACFFPVLLLSESAIRQITPRLLEVARVLRLSGSQQIYKILLPAALPRLFVAVRLAVGIALIVAVTVEIVANPIGLGFRLMQAGQSLRPAEMFATLSWIGLVGWLLNWSLLRAESVLFPSHNRKGLVA
jgi:NitT/TauT family transport system permease protein